MTINARIERLLLAGLLLSVMALPVLAQTAQQKKMRDQLKQLDQLDQLDRLEFMEHLEYANSCIRARRFDCAEEKITKAGKVAGNAQDKRALSLAQQNLISERRLQQEEQLAEQRERDRIAAAEARRQAQIQAQEAAERRREEREASAQTWRALGAIAAGAAVGNATRGLSAEQQQRAVRSAMQGVLDGDTSQFNATTNQISVERTQAHNAQMQAIREQRFREEAAARAQRQQQAQTAAAQLAQEQERQRVANQSRQQQASAQYAQAQQAQDQRAREQQAQLAKQQAEMKREEDLRLRAQEKAIADKAAADKAAADKAAAIARKEKNEADKKAAAEAKLREERDYLGKLAAGTRLGAKNCFGEQHVGGSLPRIKPEVVGCIDMHYRAYCNGTDRSRAYLGVVKTMVGMGTGCFGDTSEIKPKLACKAEEIRVEVVEARSCGG